MTFYTGGSVHRKSILHA